MQHILAATDLSGSSDRGIARALLLARDEGARLTVLHVVDAALSEDVIDDRCARVERSLRQHVAALPGAEAVTAEVAAVPGDGVLEILRQADRRQADLIVVGAHQDGPLLDLFRGTSGGRLVRGGRLPVLLARDYPAGPYRKAVLGAEPSGASDAAASFALDWLRDAHLQMVHAYEIPFAGFRGGSGAASDARHQHEDALDTVVKRVVEPRRAAIAERKLSVDGAVRRGEVVTVLRREVERQDADLLVVGTHARTGLAHAMLGSVAEDLLRAPPCDLLVVRGAG